MITGLNDGFVSGYIDDWMKWKDGWLYGWVDELMCQWLDGWNGWVNHWMDELIGVMNGFDDIGMNVSMIQ